MVYKWSEALVDVLVGIFGLAISLRVESSRKLDLGSQNSVELILESRDKLRSAVRDDRGSRSVIPVYIDKV